MPLFARQVAALLDDLELDSAVVGGTSLGANVALELTTRDPERVSGLFIEMPVLETRWPAVGGQLPPGPARPAGGPAGSRSYPALPRRSPHQLPDRHRARLGPPAPGPSGAVLEGLLLGETAPHREERLKITQPTLIVGHPRDPLHPFSDSGMLARSW